MKRNTNNSWLLRCRTALPKKAHSVCPCAVVFYAVKNRGDVTDVTHFSSHQKHGKDIYKTSHPKQDDVRK